MKINKLVWIIIILIGGALLIASIISADTTPFIITEQTEYGFTENTLYFNITENLGKNQNVNISHIFDDNDLTDQIVYGDLYMKQDVEEDIYGLVNTSLGKYATYNETILNSTTFGYYWKSDGTLLCEEVNGVLKTCDYILDDKSVLIEESGIIGTQIVQKFLPLAIEGEKIVVNGLKIEQKSDGIPVPKNSLVELRVKYKRPIAISQNQPTEMENKFNISVISVDGIDHSVLDPEWWNSSWGKCKNIVITEGSGVERINEITNINITGLNISNLNEVRIVNTSCLNDGSEVGYYLVNGSASADAGSDWIDVAFKGNYSASGTTNYSVYYNNAGVSASAVASGIAYFNSYEYGNGLGSGLTCDATVDLNTTKYSGSKGLYLTPEDDCTLTLTYPSTPYNVTMWVYDTGTQQSGGTSHYIRLSDATIEWVTLSVNDASPDRYAVLEDSSAWHYFKDVLKNSWNKNVISINSATSGTIFVNDTALVTLTLNDVTENQLLFNQASTASGGWISDFLVVGNDYNTYYAPVTSSLGTEQTLVTNTAPTTPTLNTPTDDAVNQEANVLLNVTIIDDDADAMNVTFYNATSHSAICTNNTNIANGSFVTCTWAGLTDFTDNIWYVNVTDGTETTMSSVWNFSVGDNTAPTITTPSNSTLEYLEDYLSVDFNADESVTWAVDDDTNFSINATGGLINNTILPVKTYELIITATDGNSNSADVPYKVIVQNTAPTIYIESPTEFQNFSTNTIFFNASATQNIDTWIVNWNGTNFTLTDINTSLEVLDGTYNLEVWANDSSGTFGLNNSINFTVDTTAPQITTSISDGDVFGRYGGEPTTFTFIYNITETHWTYANYSMAYPNGTLMQSNASSPQNFNFDLDIITLGVYQWVLWSNDTLSNYQKKTISFTVELDSGGGGATLGEITEEVEEGVFVAPVELTFWDKNKTWLIVLGVFVLVMVAGRKSTIVQSSRRRRK